MNNISSLTLTDQSRAESAYNLIARTANENATMQGIGGIIGTVTSIAADVAALAIYSALWDKIRTIYGHQKYDTATVKDLIPKLGQEIISDIIFDKVLGYVPVIGVITNIMCAKTMTWRLGILFSMLSSRGSTMNEETVINCVRLIRELYPQRDMFSFTTPDKISVIRMIERVEKNDLDAFDEKIKNALLALK